MKDKICSLTLIIALAAQIFASAMPGDLSVFEKSEKRQTFLDSGTAPFIAFDVSQKSRLLRYSLDSLTVGFSMPLYNCVTIAEHSSRKVYKVVVRPQINSPLLI